MGPLLSHQICTSLFLCISSSLCLLFFVSFVSLWFVSKIKLLSFATDPAGSLVRVDGGDVLEPGAVEVVLLELLGDAAARQAAVLGAAGDVPLVAGQETGEVVALDLADQV